MDGGGQAIERSARRRRARSAFLDGTRLRGRPGSAADTGNDALAAMASALAVWVRLRSRWRLASGRIAERRDARRLRRVLRSSETRARAATGARDALITAGREAVIVWGRDGCQPAHLWQRRKNCSMPASRARTPTALVRSARRAGRTGRALRACTAHDKDERIIAIRGRAVGAFVAVWLEEEPKAYKASLDFQSVLDALPLPVWLRDRTLSLIWGNRAFLNRDRRCRSSMQP